MEKSKVYFTSMKAVTDLPASSVTPAMVVTADFPMPWSVFLYT